MRPARVAGSLIPLRAVIVALAAAACVSNGGAAGGRTALPASLADAEYWQLVGDFSEPDGYFDSDNLLSNETTFQFVIPRLTRIVEPGAAYLGVGPEQNFAYILAVRPAIAFIIDIRRGNLQEHLMYKALFELSADRADFLSRLFARPRPAGLAPEASASDLLDAFARVPSDEALFRRTLAGITDRLAGGHRFPLSAVDKAGIEYVYRAFRTAGPSLSYNSSRVQRTPYPTYAELQQETDGEGRERGYLASEANFQAMKRFEERNLLVPLVGDFAGPKTLRAVGGYLRQHDVTVGAFYTSNVENYLFQNGEWQRFGGNVKSLPLDASSTFIRACFDRCQGAPGSRSTTLLDSMTGLMADVDAGRIRTYWDVIGRTQ